MLSVAIPYSDLAAYQCQSFRGGYDFIWRERRVRLDFYEIVLTIPEFAFRKDAKLAGLSAIDHLPKVGSVCHKVYFSLDARHAASGFTPDGVRLGLGRHGWLWHHCGTIGFALITLAFALEIIALFSVIGCMPSPAAAVVKPDWQRAAFLAHIPSTEQEIDCKVQSNSR
jgi:hypothetical protein